MVSQEEVRAALEAFGLGALKHLRGKHGNSETASIIEMRHDVFRFLFKNKGEQSKRRGWLELRRQDFSNCELPQAWDSYVDHLGDGKKVVYPILVRPVLQRGPKSYTKGAKGALELLPQYNRECVKICFSTTAHTVNNV